MHVCETVLVECRLQRVLQRLHRMLVHELLLVLVMHLLVNMRLLHLLHLLLLLLHLKLHLHVLLLLGVVVGARW